MSIWEKKRAYERFAREASRSEFLLSLSRRNSSLRHIIRFLFHSLVFSALLLTICNLAERDALAALVFYPFYLFFQALVIAGSMIHSHELSHNHIRSRWLNDCVGILSGAFSFINFYSFQRAHRLHHANIGNLDSPEAGAPVSLRGQEKLKHNDRPQRTIASLFDFSYLLGFLLSWPIFIYYGDYNSWMLPYRRASRWEKKSSVVFILFALVNLGCLFAFPMPYLVFYLPAVLLGGQRILAVTYMHHAHENSVFFGAEHHNFLNVMMWTTDRDFGPIVNFFMLNNGYHIPHHVDPRIPYYDLKKASRYLREKIPSHLSYNFDPKGQFYIDFALGLYEQRLDANYEFYQLKYLEPDAPFARFLRGTKR